MRHSTPDPPFEVLGNPSLRQKEAKDGRPLREHLKGGPPASARCGPSAADAEADGHLSPVSPGLLSLGPSGSGVIRLLWSNASYAVPPPVSKVEGPGAHSA